MTSDYPLYDRAHDHAACGLGFVARIDGASSREIVERSLEMLGNLSHRGASGSDAATGDGAGILLQMPDALLRRECKRNGFHLPAPGDYAAGMLFLPVEEGARAWCESTLEHIAIEEGQRVIGWRDVPVELHTIGESARATAPRIRQVFIQRRTGNPNSFALSLYRIRRRLHWSCERNEEIDGCYVVSLSTATLVYKGLLQGPQLVRFYPDLRDPAISSSLALVHSRFSTNTLGSWPLAHPFRYVAHNGEINTVRGNINWMRAREGELQSAIFGGDTGQLGPMIQPGQSDSAAFDNVLEFMVLAGRSLPQAIMTMVPEAWENNDQMDPDSRAFYEYNSALMPPWDGPAAIAFSDGRLVGASLDRNGLRPARYVITRDGLVVLASEDGAIAVQPEDVVERWRLQPGKMLVVDTTHGCLLRDGEVKQTVARRYPFQSWLQQGSLCLDEAPGARTSAKTEGLDTLRQQRVFGYTDEDLSVILTPMALDGKEADGSMGIDTPLAILSERPQLLFSYFKQLFAQVTNPPIDPLREDLVMSLRVSLGSSAHLLRESSDQAERIVLGHPVLSDRQLASLIDLNDARFRPVRLPALFPVAGGPAGLENALGHLCTLAAASIEDGANLIVLSDRGVDAAHSPIPSLLATAAVHHHLVRSGQRTRASLIVETGEAREVHHLALLIGYGAAAVNPYLALATVEQLAASGRLADCPIDRALDNFFSALQKGLLKVISKMGISTVASYCGAQVFEAVGLDNALIGRHFCGTPSRIGGIDLTELADQVLARHRDAFKPGALSSDELEIAGEYRSRPEGERHQWDADGIVPLQRAVRTGEFSSFGEFTAHVDRAGAASSNLRGLLDFRRDPIEVQDVEPAEDIVSRFCTGAMSFGSLSQEAHETLAVAMNRIGAKSNTGEGGEDAERFRPDENGDSRRSAIKQVASGRFGVTAHYLVNADVLQIKMAQGSKPGEGGQLPGHKVTLDIARTRHSIPGVGLISPPPHHDIYSIEDLAQLIYDLKSINPGADVNVKLVSEVGVGTIAAGVAKAKADQITISGYDGGTGASPMSSIRHAGLPWELGLAETQQVLVANNLRGRVRLQVDGHLKTGRDVVVAALLGAEEFGFATAPLIAMGCIMMRACHLNTCPVGIATQRPELRRKFAGKPENVINYFFFLAQEVRQYMAALGFRRFEDIVGRTDRLQLRQQSRGRPGARIDLSALIRSETIRRSSALRQNETQQHDLGGSLDGKLLPLARAALESKRPVRLYATVKNTDRAVGTVISGEIARCHGACGFPDDTIQLSLTGTAGQSFGAWAAKGLTLILEGSANDGTGKGLSGGKIIVAPPANAGYLAERSIITGNVALYGATAGEAYFRGVAGERFAVRNSGADAVVEGVGDHGCEYMTGGTIIVLGSTGRNFAAGMSGGVAFVLDLWGRFNQSCNRDMVGLEPLVVQEDIRTIRRLLKRHLTWTGSSVAQRVLDNWSDYQSRFVKVMPHDLQRVLLEREETEREDRAV